MTTETTAAEWVEFAVESGALVAAPVWSNHQHANNWMAVISVDPLSPGGLGRRFMPKAKGDYYYIINSLRVGDAVEFSGDVSGSIARTRWFGFVRSISKITVVLEHTDTAKQAIKLAKPVRQAHFEAEQARQDELYKKQQAEQAVRRAAETAAREARKAARLAAAQPAAKKARMLAKLIEQRDALRVRLAKIEQDIVIIEGTS